MQMRSSDEKAVRPSVRPSVKRVHCDKTEERPVHIFIPYESSFSLVFWEEEWLVGGRATHSTWNFGWLTPVGAKSSILNRYSLAVTPSEKSSNNTNGPIQWA